MCRNPGSTADIAPCQPARRADQGRDPEGTEAGHLPLDQKKDRLYR